MINRKNEMVWNKELGIYVLPKVEEKGLKDVLVFQVCECDSVAAYSCDEAIAWYKEYTGLNDDELHEYDLIETVPFEREVWDGEEKTKRITVREIVDTYWEGKPFIVTTELC
jgi:hypothetical protein